MLIIFGSLGQETELELKVMDGESGNWTSSIMFLTRLEYRQTVHEL